VVWRSDGQALAAGGDEGAWVMWPLTSSEVPDA